MHTLSWPPKVHGFNRINSLLLSIFFTDKSQQHQIFLCQSRLKSNPPSDSAKYISRQWLRKTIHLSVTEFKSNFSTFAAHSVAGIIAVNTRSPLKLPKPFLLLCTEMMITNPKVFLCSYTLSNAVFKSLLTHALTRWPLPKVICFAGYLSLRLSDESFIVKFICSEKRFRLYHLLNPELIRSQHA